MTAPPPIAVSPSESRVSPAAGARRGGGARVAYLATARPDIWDQALYAAWSALAWRGEEDVQVHVFTDRPEAFTSLAGQIHLEPLPPERAREWVEPWGLVYRLKPRALEDLFDRFPADKAILLDSDTFFIGPVQTMLHRIGARRAVMHLREYSPLTRDSLEMTNFRRRMRRARFRGAPVSLEPWMWNAGVVGLDPADRHLVQDWMDFIDETYPANPKGSVEQYGISWLIQQSDVELSAVDDVVYHYYPDKDRYLAAIRAELEVLRALPLEAALERVRRSPVRTTGPIPPRPRTPRVRRLAQSLRTRIRIHGVIQRGAHRRGRAR
jgi:hypothetical protein